MLWVDLEQLDQRNGLVGRRILVIRKNLKEDLQAFFLVADDIAGGFSLEILDELALELDLFQVVVLHVLVVDVIWQWPLSREDVDFAHFDIEQAGTLSHQLPKLAIEIDLNL